MGQTQGSEGFAMAAPTWELNEIGRHPSYHGTMDKSTAEATLRKQDNSCYLTRYGLTRKVYVLSVMKRKKTNGRQTLKHFKIKIQQENGNATYEISGSQAKYNSISKLLEFYQTTHLGHEVGKLGKCLVSDNYTPVTEEFSQQYEPACDQTHPPHEARKKIIADLSSAIQDYIKEEILDLEEIPEDDQPGRRADSDSDHSDYKKDKTQRNNLSEKLPVRPTINKLTLIKWTDQDKQTHKFRLFDRISDRWFDAGLLVGLDSAVLNDYKQRYADNMTRCVQVFSDWVNNGNMDYPPTWEGLYMLLRDIKKANIAEELKRVLATKDVHLN